MSIDLRKLSALSTKELTFIYSMLAKYGGMPLHVEEEYQPQQNKNNNHYNKKNKKKSPPKKRGKTFPVDKSKPNLYDFDDPLWDTCEDKNFLIYRIIMERLE